MATGKVKTLYSDKEKSEALFPRTKTSAISDANGVGLDALLENLLYSGTGNPEAAVAPLDADTLGGIPADDYATENFVATKIAEAQMSGGSGNVDLSGYATKDELNSATNNLAYISESNQESATVPLNADTLDGKNPSAFMQYADATDYIVEQDTSGIWTYRKWNSGIAELWTKPSSFTGEITPTALMGGYYTYISIDLPFNITDGTGYANGRLGTGVGAAYIRVDPTYVVISIIGNQNSSSMSCTCHLYGKWK